MKELSIEQKAKRYDEALERAMYWEKNPTVWSSDDICQKLFPELTESEDERIKKALLEMVHDTTGDELWVDYNIHKEEALAWLEKQDKTITKKDVDDAYLKGVCDAKQEIEKQGKQKPAEVRTTGCWHVEDVEQNHTWSKEDEEMLKMVIKSCEQCGNEYAYYWLKSLKDRVQPKQEWSEEDETMATNIIIMLKEGASHHFNKKDIAKGVDWLKSLRPHSHWKPSDEQMEALDRAQAELCSTEYNKSICDLIDSLKKLKG